MVARYLREGLNQLPLVLLLAAFCLPLFFGLGRTDLENDEAIYSYAVESILHTGDWASPRSSPSPDIVFLEKPPLKFWIVAAPIRLGLLPYNEFGLRFWDALFGGVAFVYVFLIGRRLSGAVCGTVALVVLFAHQPLLFTHGLRSNNMEAALFLAYCGGIYHYLALASATGRRRAVHIGAIGAWFVLGFMTKFVAALFLPLILGAAIVLLPAHRRALATDWRHWLFTAMAGAAVILPWFVYQHLREGEALWQVMFGDHVYTRFTEHTDPSHLQPWHFYISEVWRQFVQSSSAIWVAFGLIVLTVQTARRRLAEGVVILLWLVIPVPLISLGTSKLYHYFYPYLPPLALAAGYGVGWLFGLASRVIGRRFGTAPPGQARRWVFDGLTALALAVALLTLIEPIRIQFDGRTIFSNHSVVRPLLAALIFAALAGWGRFAVAAAAVLSASLMIPSPLDGYTASLQRLGERRHPLRSLGECLREADKVRSAKGEVVLEPYTPVYDSFLHPYFYYLRGSEWLREPDPATLYSGLFSAGSVRPVVMDANDYAEFLARPDLPPQLPRGISRPGIVVLLPGDYAECRFAQGVWTQ